MRIICPNCTSHYEVDTDKIGAEGQLVRCSQCREVWLVNQPEASGLPLAPLTVEHNPEPRPVWPERDPATAPIDFQLAKARMIARSRRRQGESGIRSTLALIAVGVLMMSGTIAALSGRDAIARRVPAAGAVYAALGIPANPEGLALRDVHSALVAEGNQTVLTLQGTIANLRDGSTQVPNLAVVVRDGDKSALYSWTAPAPKAELAKGETVAFHSRLAAPPASGKDVRISFVEAAAL